MTETKAQKETKAAQGIGGYIRVSRIDFPAACQAAPDRVAYIEMLRQVRMAELIKDAALQGETITDWYDDLGVSGRGKFLPRRVAFAKARRDAKDGRLQALYARDLSRLFRNVVQQELWFVEMEDLGITVHAQDLPFASDPATRRLLRQQMGIIHEYVSSRMGSLMRERMATRISSGLGIGLHRSKWGLAYNSARKAFDFDPATADKVRLVYETYVACGGSGGQTAKELNLLLALGHPRATPTPHGNTWDHAAVFNLIDCHTYRRIIKYGTVLLPAPDRIPEVVSPDTIARVDALLIPRRQYYREINHKRTAGLLRFTYSGLLRCGYCGGAMRSKTNGKSGEGQMDWVSYRCKAAGLSRGCTMNHAAQQRRLNALVGQGLECAFQSFIGLSLPSVPANTVSHSPSSASSLSSASIPLSSPPVPAAIALAAIASIARQKALSSLDQKRERYLELYAHGLLRDEEELQRCLNRVEQERLVFESPRVQERDTSGAATCVLSAPEAGPLQARFAAVWPTDWNQLLDGPKHDLLQNLRASISVRLLPHTSKEPSKTDRHRFNGGRLTLILELPALGFVGVRALHLAESDEQLHAYWEWRTLLAKRKSPGHPAEEEKQSL